MKMLKLTTIMAAAIAFIGIAPSAYAFHSGGVGECEGCHTMHNSIGNKPYEIENGHTAVLPQFQSGQYLLKGTDPASACLNCHNQPDTAPSSYHISTDETVSPAGINTGIAPSEMTPGGDFNWLKKDFTFTVRGTPETDYGEGHGHNIVASDYNYKSDTVLANSPGGNYPANKLYCSSCHDPHGKYRRFADGSVATTGLPIFNSGSYQSSAAPISGVSAVGVYRLLGGVGYNAKSAGDTSLAFTAPSPDAVVNSSYNRSEATQQTHVAYGQGMSEWCANCHGNIHTDSYTSGQTGPGTRHPAGNYAKMTAVADNYNAYVTSGIMNPAQTAGQAYSTLVPFEIGTNDYTVLKAAAVNTDTAWTIQASSSTNVMCLSCHRAHASGFPSMTRFFLENEFMTIADASNAAAYDGRELNTEGKIHFGKTVAETTAAYYGRPASKFGPYARNQCNKCHAKD